MKTAAAETLKLLLLEDHAMFRQALASVLGKEPDFKVVGQFGSSAEALAALGHSGATMVLLDAYLGRDRALDFVVESRKKGFKGQLLVVTAGVGGREAVQLIEAGVSGILHKHHSIDVLRAVIRQIAAGEVYLEQQYVAPLCRSADRTRTQDWPLLTDRDKVVLRHIFQGLSNREIGVRLQITESGVKSSLRQLFDKLGVRTRAQLVKIALEEYRDQL